MFIHELVQTLADRVDAGAKQLPEAAEALGAAYGKQRAEQGCYIPLIVIEVRLLQRVISYVLQRNLIRMDLSTVIADMLEIGEALQEHLEFALRAYQAHKTSQAA
jgi:hypothetical protein